MGMINLKPCTNNNKFLKSAGVSKIEKSQDLTFKADYKRAINRSVIISLPLALGLASCVKDQAITVQDPMQPQPQVTQVAQPANPFHDAGKQYAQSGDPLNKCYQLIDPQSCIAGYNDQLRTSYVPVQPVNIPEQSISVDPQNLPAQTTQTSDRLSRAVSFVRGVRQNLSERAANRNIPSQIAQPTGNYSLPVEGYELTLTSGFGNRPNINGGNFDEFHYGADFVAGKGEGAPVLSIADGVVVESYNGNPPNIMGGIGHNVIVQQADGNYVQYGHLRDVYVSEGQTVNAGGPLGTIGNTGKNTTGPHLHLGVSCNVESSPIDYQNPAGGEVLRLNDECSKDPLQVYPHIGRLFEKPLG